MWSRLSFPLHYSWFPSQIGAVSFGLFSSFVVSLKIVSSFLFVVSLCLVFFCLCFWWDLLLVESEGGEMSFQDSDNVKLSLSLFILSEAMFFITFFWTFFHYAFSPSILGGHEWPPVGVVPIDPSGLPLLNTLLLVSSGVTVTWAHHLLLSGEKEAPCMVLFLTAILGAWFLVNQALEFKEAPLTMADGTYGSIFLVLTGFHGFHVVLGAVLIVETGTSFLDFHYTSHCHSKAEILIWYWHFVDCVWLIVYCFVYWWGG